MQYLITKLTDSTGYPFTHVTKARENETFTVVEAESKADAIKKVEDLIRCPGCKSQNVDYEYYYEDIDEPSYVYIVCHNCEGVCLDEIRKDSDQ